MASAPSIHASCVLTGAGAVLIRGASGSGKSRLALALLQAATRGDLPFARLVSDDRTVLTAAHGRLLARPVAELRGLIELRHIGIRPMSYEEMAVVILVVDLAEGAARMPEAPAQTTEIAGITLPRLELPPQAEALPLVLGKLRDLRPAAGQPSRNSPLSEK